LGAAGPAPQGSAAALLDRMGSVVGSGAAMVLDCMAISDRIPFARVCRLPPQAEIAGRRLRVRRAVDECL
jgi:hypothetical protein